MTFTSERIYCLICGILASTLACIVMIGWHIEDQVLVQISPNFAPMQYNTALGFLMSGIGLIMAAAHQYTLARAFGVFTLVLGLASLSQYMFQYDLGIDNLFVTPEFTTRTTHPGRMSTNTALCFSLFGVALASLKIKRELAIGFSCAVLALSLISLLSYTLPHETADSLGAISRMALHTATGFLLISIGLITFNLSDWIKSKNINLWRAAPFSIAITFAVLSTVAWHIMAEETHARNRAYLESIVNDTHTVLLDRYQMYEQSLRGGLGLFYASNTVERAEWQQYAQAIDVEKTLPGINGIGYIDYVLAQDLEDYIEEARTDDFPEFTNHPDTFYPDKFIIKFIEPVENNLKAVGLDIGFEANRRAAAERARDLGVAALTKKILLVQDQKKQAGFLLLIPFYGTGEIPTTIKERRKKFKGWVYAPFIGPNFFTGVSVANNGQLDFSVYDGKKAVPEALIYTSHNHEHIEETSTLRHVTQMRIAGRTWTIEWHPNENYTPPADQNLSSILFIFGILFSLFLYAMLRHLLFIQDTINDKVRERTSALKESENKQKAILHNTVDAILTFNKHGIIQSFNPAAERMFGYSKNDAIGQNIKMLMPSDHSKKHESHIERFITTDEKHITGTTREIEARHKSGKVFPIALSISEVELTKGRLFSGIIRDISEQKKNELAIKASIQFQELIMDSIPDLVFVKNSDYQIVEANKAFIDLHPDLDRKSLIGANSNDGYKPEEAAEFTKHDEIAFEEGYSETEETITFPDGITRTLFTQKVRFENINNESFILGIGRDITQAKEYQDKIENMNTELKRSNQELERFAYIASHDLQEPLRKIGGFTERLEKHYEDLLRDDPKAQKYMEFITDGVKRMRELILGLLAYSRVTTSEYETVELDSNKIVGSAIENISQLIKENDAKVEFKDLPNVYCDKVMFTQLFQNLIGNSIKYRSSRTPEIKITAKKRGKFIEFAVQDNSIGMEEQYLERIFEMFQRLHRKEEISGTGIGLSLCQKIVERYGGTIWVESEPDVGSTFFFTIPADAG